MMARSLTYSFTLNDEIALLICESNGTCASKTNRSARAARRGAGVTRERFLLSFARSYGPLTLYKSRLGKFPLPNPTRFGRERQGHQERVDGRGEGSIVRRADGRWMGRVDLGWQDGKRRSKAIYSRTRRTVVDGLRDTLKAAEQGTLSADERQTIGEFLKRWLQDVVRPRVRPRTFVGYEAAIDHHISPHLGRLRLAKT